MEKYLGVKVIEAEQQERYKDVDYENCLLKNKQEGYKVVYPDGYESWSPKEVFEEAYRRIDNLTFGLAIEALKKGYKVARKGWNGKGMFLLLAKDIEFQTEADLSEMNEMNVSTGKSIVMKTATNDFVVGWLASQTDMLAEDWMVVE